MEEATGLRERKKQATRKAISEAALRLALRDGPDSVRVDDVAAAADVSPRTYNNYFSSREEAIVAAVVTERDRRVARAVAGRRRSRLADAVIESVVEQYVDPPTHDAKVLLLLTTSDAIRDAYLDAVTELEAPLTDVIAERIGAADKHVARVLSASVAAAVRIGLRRWLQPADQTTSATGLVVPSGSLAELLRSSLAPLEPALDAAESSTPRRSDE